MPMAAIDSPDMNSQRITDEQREALRAADPDALADDDLIDGEAPATASIDATESDDDAPGSATAARVSVPMISKPRLDEVLNRVSELEH